MIDLRSDTVTRPGAAMRRAMAEAEVGDDVFGEDPTVNRLQEHIALLLGKEAALFVPSGVMGNQIALRVHTSPGDEIILDAGSHIANYESGAGAALAGVQLRTVASEQGHPTSEDIRVAIRAGHYWEPNPRLICLENTHNKAGGTISPLSGITQIREVADSANLAMHLDGARLWNASAATGVPEADYAAPFDSVTVCLSKGLGAPAGSVLAGEHSFIQKARRIRKMYGGGMRQAGILAAAGLYALENHRSELPRDHILARRLAEKLAECPCFSIDMSRVQSNIIMFNTEDGRSAENILEEMKHIGILMVAFGPVTIRATLHRDVSEAQIDQAIEDIGRHF